MLSMHLTPLLLFLIALYAYIEMQYSDLTFYINIAPSEFVRMMMFNVVSLIVFINIYVVSCEYMSLIFMWIHG